MHRVRIFWLGLLLPLTGCNLFWYAGHNLIEEPRARIDEFQVTRRMKAEAEQTWAAVCRQYDGRCFSREFADGFVEGYVDYLEHGGESRPPTVPPPRYRRAAYLTPSGYERAKDYMIGFKYGADVAQSTGRRHFHTVPVLLPEPKGEQPLNITTHAESEGFPAPPLASDHPATTPAPMTLPVPKSMPVPEPAKGLPEPKPMVPDAAPKSMPMPTVPSVAPPATPLPPELRPSGGPIPGIHDLIQAINEVEQTAADLPVLELPIRGPRGFDARYLAPTLFLIGDETPGH